MEERRLMYVGITRAKDQLYLVLSQTRSSYGYPEPVDPSRFLADIPPDLLDGLRRREPRSTDSAKAEHDRHWYSSSGAAGNQNKGDVHQFHPGMRVYHASWGDGMVLNSKLEDDDEIVDIFFEDMGLKRVVASLAGLKILS